MREIAEAVLPAEWGESSRRSPRAFDLLLEGIAVVTIDGYAAGAPRLKRALRGFHEAMSRRGGVALAVARTPRRPASARRRSRTSSPSVRSASRVRPASCRSCRSRWRSASACSSSSATSSRRRPWSWRPKWSRPRPAAAWRRRRALLAALRGEEAEATALIDAGRREVVDRGEGLWLVITEWASAVLFNGLGRYEEALAAAEQAVGHPHELGVSTWVQPEFSRGGRTQRPSRARSRPAAPAPGDQQRRRHGLGARRRGALTRVAQRG